MNTLGASRAKVGRSAPLMRLVNAIGCGFGDVCTPESVEGARYDRIIILCDPDVDGVHIRALLTVFFSEWLGPVLDAEMVYVAQAPLWRITSPQLEAPMLIWSDRQYQQVDEDLDARGIHERTNERFRGLGNVDPKVLFRTCLDPEHRRLIRLTREHATSTIASFNALRSQLRPS